MVAAIAGLFHGLRVGIKACDVIRMRQKCCITTHFPKTDDCLPAIQGPADRNQSRLAAKAAHPRFLPIAPSRQKARKAKPSRIRRQWPEPSRANPREPVALLDAWLQPQRAEPLESEPTGANRGPSWSADRTKLVLQESGGRRHHPRQTGAWLLRNAKYSDFPSTRKRRATNQSVNGY